MMEFRPWGCEKWTLNCLPHLFHLFACVPVLPNPLTSSRALATGPASAALWMYAAPKLAVRDSWPFIARRVTFEKGGNLRYLRRGVKRLKQGAEGS